MDNQPMTMLLHNTDLLQAAYKGHDVHSYARHMGGTDKISTVLALKDLIISCKNSHMSSTCRDLCSAEETQRKHSTNTVVVDSP